MEYSPFDAPPTLPPPGPPAGRSGGTPAGAPTSTPSSAPSGAPSGDATPVLPQPVLPAAPAAPAVPAPTTAAAPPPPFGTAPTEPAGPTPNTKRGKRRRGRALVFVVLVGLLAGGGFLAWQTLGSDDDTASDDVLVESDDGSDAGDGSIGQLAVDAIEEAEAVVDEINDNSEETELLSELGLDPTGNPVEESAAPDEPTRYSYMYDRPDLVSLIVNVDAAAGSYRSETSDGVGTRFVDGTAYLRPAANDDWSVVDGATDPPGPFLSAFPTLETIIDDAVRPFVIAEETRDNGFGTVHAFLIDDHAFHATDPDGRSAWLAPWGLVDAHVPEPPATTEFSDDLYGVDAPGLTIVDVTFDSNGRVGDVKLISQATGGFHWVSSMLVYGGSNPAEPTPIEAPAIGS